MDDDWSDVPVIPSIPPPTPVPVHQIHDMGAPDFLSLQNEINSAVAALPLDAPVAIMATAGNKGAKAAVLVRAGNKFSFEGWLSETPGHLKNPDWGVGAIYYPWRK